MNGPPATYRVISARAKSFHENASASVRKTRYLKYSADYTGAM